MTTRETEPTPAEPTPAPPAGPTSAPAAAEPDPTPHDGAERAGAERAGTGSHPPLWWRGVAIAAYALALGLWVRHIGVPTDPFLAFGWLWLAAMAWYVGLPWRRQFDFVRDWWPAFAVLVLYMYSRGLSDELINMPVAWEMPIRVDEWMFAGDLPTAVLQDRLCGEPCLRASDPRWWDVLFTTVYYSHFVVALVLAFVLWLRNRAEWAIWLPRYVGMNLAGLVVYILYPMAPPWLASQEGHLSEEVVRLTGRGWRDLGLGGFHTVLAKVGNPVAAMPSLHAGIAALVALYALTRVRSIVAKVLILAYPVVMAFALVYYAEHYVIDIVAGWALAAAVTFASAWWVRRRRTRVTSG